MQYVIGTTVDTTVIYEDQETNEMKSIDTEDSLASMMGGQYLTFSQGQNVYFHTKDEIREAFEGLSADKQDTFFEIYNDGNQSIDELDCLMDDIANMLPVEPFFGSSATRAPYRSFIEVCAEIGIDTSTIPSAMNPNNDPYEVDTTIIKNP